MAACSPAMGCSAESLRVYGNDGTIRGEQIVEKINRNVDYELPETAGEKHDPDRT